ncbi:hypothetical protein [Streptomyces sp. HNM1019]|uniref:hypothetical protein n=1 Tax=Streptomyces sp. HNM1019 TaxID=3424717 RepID=UPI003D77F4AD
MQKRWAAGVAVAGLALAGLASIGSAHAAEAPLAGCAIQLQAVENVKVLVTDGKSVISPPKDKAGLKKATVAGILKKGRKKCALHASSDGAKYTINRGSNCFEGTNNFWDPIRFKGVVGWVATACD